MHSKVGRRKWNQVLAMPFLFSKEAAMPDRDPLPTSAQGPADARKPAA